MELIIIYEIILDKKMGSFGIEWTQKGFLKNKFIYIYIYIFLFSNQ
jgi:hypothetical protein